MHSGPYMVIDGNSLAHRAFHAIPLLSTSQGIITNAVYGFVVMLLKVLADRNPRCVIVCFDKGKITFRHKQYEAYKGTRKATPDELRPQFPLIKEMLEVMGIKILEMDGYEADDLIGTMITLAEKQKMRSLILTSDNDVLQLISPLTTVLLTKKGITGIEEYDLNKVTERFGLSPRQLIDLKGLVGDVSDNIPGIPGIGEKTGVKLIREFGSLEELLKNTAKISPRLAGKVDEYADQARLSKSLATIDRNVPVDINPAQCAWSGPNYNNLLPFLSKLEFRSLINNISKQLNEAQETGKGMPGGVNDGSLSGLKNYQVDFKTLTDKDELAGLRKKLADCGEACLMFDGSRADGVAAAAISTAGGENYYIPVSGAAALDFIIWLAGSPRPGKICYDAKNDMWLLAKHGAELRGLSFDVNIAAYLLNPSTSGRTLDNLALENFQLTLPAWGAAALCARADVVRKLAGFFAPMIKEMEMEKLYYEVELPLVRVLFDMERGGVKVDAQILGEMSAELGARIEELAVLIYEQAGRKFNINSTRQLGQVLFEELKLPVIKKTKTGYSTDAGVLEELTGTHDIVGHIILHRQLMKLKSTYVDGLIPLIDPDTGLVHTTFNQDVTATGRLSSTEPNLQNIPIRLEEGRRIRKVFKPSEEGHVILAADYSQVELRILAHMSKDPAFLESFRLDQDIHSRTASEVFGVPIDKVTAEMRGRAKAVNFGIIYGMSDFGLARDIKVSRQEASRYIKSYFERYKSTKLFIDKTINEARDKGYVATIMNRRRYLPDLFSPNRTIRNFGERTAINTPIQGSAADIIKLAMVKIWHEIKKRGLKTRMVLQVHDELIFDVPAQEIDEVRRLVTDCMENGVRLEVPLKVDLKMGPNWYDVVNI